MVNRRLLMLTFLLGVPIASNAGECPPISFNHFFTVLDDTTWQAIADSPFVQKELAQTQVRSTKSSVGSWTGLYLFGENTYIELFRQSARPPAPPGLVGEVNFSTERVGAIDAVLKQLTARWPAYRFFKHPITKAEGKPWFTAVEPQLDDLQLSFGVMEYDPRYLDTLSGTRKARGADDVSRARRTSEFFQPNRLLKDVVGITLALRSKEAALLEALVTTCGYQKRITPYGTIEYWRPDFYVRVQPTDGHGVVVAQGAVIALDLALQNDRKGGETTLQFSDQSKLIFSPGQRRATWLLDGRQPEVLH